MERPGLDRSLIRNELIDYRLASYQTLREAGYG